MKLPRWLHFSMAGLIVLLPILAAGWWWILFPNRTAVEFAKSLADGDLDAVYRLTADAKWLVNQPYFRSNSTIREPAVVQERSIADMLVGRVRFRLGDIPHDFVAERTSVSIPDKVTLASILEHRAAVQTWTRAVERVRVKRAVVLLQIEESLEVQPGKLDRLDVYERELAMHEHRLRLARDHYESVINEHVGVR